MTARLGRFQPKNRHYLLLTFFTALVAAAALFVPFIVLNGGVFYYYGDFNVQEIPFYQMVHDAVKSGQLGWSHTTDLGSDLLSSYSFYLMGSPFFWMTIPFPNEFVPYLIGPVLILKFACAAVSAHLYLQRYVNNRMYAVLGGLLYAFSGFSIYNVFFFHFHEPMIVFPLLLAALDAFLYDKRRGVFAVAVCAACVVNYYFFAGQVVFVVIYFLMLTLTKAYKFKFTEFLLLALETVIGFAASAFILLPSVLGIMGNPRLDTLPSGWEALVNNRAQRYWLVILGFLFPADLPAMPVFTPESNCKWASVAGWLPLFGMTGVIAFLQSAKRDWLKKIITLLMLFAFVPILNSLFQLLNSSIYYTRWFYMLVLMFILATLRALEDCSEKEWRRATVWSVSLTVGATLLIGFMPNITENENGEKNYSIGVQATFERFWIYALMALMSILAFILIFKKFRHNSLRFSIASISGVLIAALLSSYFIIGTGVISSSSTQKIKDDIINARDDIKIDDLESVRSDFYKCVDNTPMYWKIQSINCFQSSVSPSIMQFYNAMGITRDVASRPNFSVYGLRGLFSCKYYFDYNRDNDSDDSDYSFLDDKGNTKMPYWKYIKTCNNFDIYQNECYIPMGFTFDSFITEEEFERVKDGNKTEATLYSLILSREVMSKYSDITGYTDEKYELLYGDDPESFESIVDSYRYGKLQYKEQCQKLAASSCSSFEYTDDGFKAEFNNKGDDNLLFFSVPYSTGFTAYVNGSPVDIEKVDFGFMAVKVPANTECSIEFYYETPGFGTGLSISIASGCAFAIYVGVTVFVHIYKKRKISKRS